MLYKQGKIFEIKFFKKTNRKEFLSEKHPLHGGMMDNARISLKCPVEPNGARKRVLTEDEIKELSNDLQIPAETLSHYNGSFWNEYRLELTKGDRRLDLDNPLEYIDYKVAINLFPIIAPSIDRAKDHPHVKFYVEDVNAGSVRNKTKAKMRKDIYDLYDQYKDERYVLKYILEKLQKITPSTTPVETLQEMMFEELESANIDRLNSIIKDENIRIKGLLLEAVEKGILSKGADGRLKSRNAEIGQLTFDKKEQTIENVTLFLADKKNSEALNIIKALNKKEK